jgi:fructose-bisphosphate aldolase class II
MIQNLTQMLRDAAFNQYAVGSFSARYTKLIRPIIEAAMLTNSPVIVQLSEKEVIRHQVGVREFAEEFYRVVHELSPQVPAALHLDHTKTVALIRQAIEVGFTSVMIDASELTFEKNVSLTREVVDFSHPRNVTVEAELGRIGTTDFVETDADIELYTDPQQAADFCRLTNIDCLAVSVGTAHGVYSVRKPKIDLERLRMINQLTTIPLVLHGGSGVPSEMVIAAAEIVTGGVSKVNIATDLELAMLAVAGREGHMTENELNGLDPALLEKAQERVCTLVQLKITDYLKSEGKSCQIHL